MKTKMITIVLLLFILAQYGCKKDFLEEKPLDFLSSANVLTSKSGFNNYVTALYIAARDELSIADNQYVIFSQGVDISSTGEKVNINFRNYETYTTPTRNHIVRCWDWAYLQMLQRANTIITYAEKPELQSIWSSEAERNRVIAEARFFRAYTHNFLANMFGGVPIVEELYTGPKTDFVRSTRQQVYESAKNDLVFASQWLPATVPTNEEGRLVKAAADHLLAEVYISLGDFDKSIQAASAVINSNLYKLMDTRFGKYTSEPGDYYSDLFKTGNTNRSSGNMETIFAWQFEDVTPGGDGTANNRMLRAWSPFLVNVKDPAGKAGMIYADSLGRGVGWVRPSPYFLYEIWGNDFNNDIRNSPNNIRRQFYYNNPASAYYNKPVTKAEYEKLDTMQLIYPNIRKVEGKISYKGATSSNLLGATYSDWIVYRLAETYLLRAEAYFRKNDLTNAAKDINVVRTRAKATPVQPAQVTLDYILDERGRELIVEEPRLRTLIRTGKLIERVRKYNMNAETRNTIKDKHALMPIPQTAIDANFSIKLEQNPGY